MNAQFCTLHSACGRFEYQGQAITVEPTDEIQKDSITVLTPHGQGKLTDSSEEHSVYTGNF